MRIFEITENNQMPIKNLDGLYHVGSLDASKKGSFSYEGAGLSVTTHPDAWRKIAKGQVSGDTYSVSKASNSFLDTNKLNSSHKEQMKKWAIKNDLLKQQETVTVSWYDDEMEDTLSQTFNSMADAKAEYGDEWDEYDIDIDKGGIVPTDKLKQATGQSRIEATGVLEYILPLYAETLGLDGVWWQDQLDTSKLSAPRGVILPSKVKTFKFTVNENFANDNAVANARARTKELYAVQKAIDDIYDDPNWKTRKDELKKLIRRESVLEKEMQLVGSSNMHRYDHDSLGNKIKENFADGKVKGKSRPGRVKKSGASCNGSVTDLRAKAKKASGEKAKMYHWCANMKSGKKKK